MSLQNKRKSESSGEQREKLQRTDSHGNRPTSERDLNVVEDTAESPIEDQVLAGSTNYDHGPGENEQHAYTKAVETLQDYPNEVWGLVLRQLESVPDFARIQRVSKTFYALALLNCWTKIRRIEVKRIPLRAEMDLVNAVIFTGVPEQKLVTTATLAPLFLGKLIQKATKTAAFDLDLAWVKEAGRDLVLANLLGALATSLTKIKEFKLRNVFSLPFQPSRALALFLTTNAESLTRLTVENSFGQGFLVRPQLRQAFQDCTSLEDLEIFGCGALVDVLLPQKPNLKSLGLLASPHSSVATLLGCGAKLDIFSSPFYFLEDYLREVQLQNRSLDHPLESVKILKLGSIVGMTSLPWSHLPNLVLVSCDNFQSIENLVDLLVSYLTQWSAGGAVKSLEFRMETLAMFARSEHVTRLAMMVMGASQCQTMVHHHMCIHHEEHTLEFQKGNATIRVLIGHC